MKERAVSAVFFDLDGTLIDSAPDLVGALNDVLAYHGRRAVSEASLRSIVGMGSQAILMRGFGIAATDPSLGCLKDHFLTCYQQRMLKNTYLFPGIQETLFALEARGVRWGIVTNKPDWLTLPLLSHLGLLKRACCVVSGNELPARKPSPLPLQYACRLSRVCPEESVYVGDALIDAQSAQAAGMRHLLAAYGYLPHEEIHTWNVIWADRVDEPLQLLDWLKRH